MISIPLDQLYGWINAFLLPLSRIAAMLAVAPVLGDSAIPARVKTAAAIVLTMALAPAIPHIPQSPPGSWLNILTVAQQIVIGLAMGLCLRIIFGAVQMAGELAGLQMGLSFATLLDPATGSNTTVLSRIFNIIALLFFVALDGHLLMLSGLMHSFSTIPISSTPIHVDGIGVLIEWGGQLMTASLLMSLPIITALLSMNLAMGILNRSAPQISIFSVGFPVSLLAGLVALMVALPNSQNFLEGLFSSALETMMRITIGLSGQTP